MCIGHERWVQVGGAIHVLSLEEIKIVFAFSMAAAIHRYTLVSPGYLEVALMITHRLGNRVA